MSGPSLPRRRFLGTLGLGAAALAVGSLPRVARRALAAVADTTPSDFIVRNDWPEHLETTVEALGRTWITPNERFFVRSHFPVPEAGATPWHLEVTGRVKTPLSMTLAQLQAIGSSDMACVLECAGNGRARYALANTSGTQWDLGAVGNARWTGLRLDTLLDRAGLESDAAHVWFECADSAPFGDAPPFLRSIPLSKMADDVMLAWRMNGFPIPRRHGGPVRAIVPGWYGMASAKWVTKVRVETAPSDNHFMARGYRYNFPGDDPAAAPPVEELRVKSLITRPLDGSTIDPGDTGKIRLQGFAWAAKGVRLVEVTTDGGKTWRPAGFMGDSEPHSWRLWATEEPLAPGQTLVIRARATDAAGNVQPIDAKPNAGGYGNNSIHEVTVHGAA